MYEQHLYVISYIEVPRDQSKKWLNTQEIKTGVEQNIMNARHVIVAFIIMSRYKH